MELKTVAIPEFEPVWNREKTWQGMQNQSQLRKANLENLPSTGRNFTKEVIINQTLSLRQWKQSHQTWRNVWQLCLLSVESPATTSYWSEQLWSPSFPKGYKLCRRKAWASEALNVKIARSCDFWPTDIDRCRVFDLRRGKIVSWVCVWSCIGEQIGWFLTKR